MRMILFTNTRAIVKFHGLKLKEINDIIKELWVKTYRGNGKICY